MSARRVEQEEFSGADPEVDNDDLGEEDGQRVASKGLSRARSYLVTGDELLELGEGFNSSDHFRRVYWRGRWWLGAKRSRRLTVFEAQKAFVSGGHTRSCAARGVASPVRSSADSESQNQVVHSDSAASCKVPGRGRSLRCRPSPLSSIAGRDATTTSS